MPVLNEKPPEEEDAEGPVVKRKRPVAPALAPVLNVMFPVEPDLLSPDDMTTSPVSEFIELPLEITTLPEEAPKIAAV